MIPRRFLPLFTALFLGAAPVRAEPPLIAIDVLLKPHGAMLGQAADWNARMRAQIPDGFRLDEAHAPHISLVQCFVAKSDLPLVLAAVDQAKRPFDTSKIQMKAIGLYYIPSGKIGLAGIVVAPSRTLLDLQLAMIKAVKPFTQHGGSASAFVPDPTGAPFDPQLFKYVETFIPSQTGEKFNPHVTVGIAPVGWLEEREKQPFSAFTFGTEGIAVYHLGNFGTAYERLDNAK